MRPKNDLPRNGKKTRSSSGDKSNSLLGQSAEMKSDVLPTYEDVMKHLYWLKKSPTQKISELASQVANCVIDIWFDKASIPTISKESIVERIVAYYNRCRDIERNKSKSSSKEKIEEFRRKFHTKLFDVAPCKCRTPGIRCSCGPESKVPPAEVAFYLDQRKDRKMRIGSLDVPTSQRLQKQIALKQLRSVGLRARTLTSVSGPAKNSSEDSSTEQTETEGSTTGSEFDPGPRTRAKKAQARLNLGNVSAAAYRTGVSERAAALIATATLQDAGLVSKEDQSQVVDKSKVRREKEKTAKIVRFEEKIQDRKPRGIYFDGRKDNTVAQVPKGNKFHRREVKEEHITLVEEPTSRYLGHTTPSSGHGEVIAKSIVDYAKDNGVNLQDLEVLGCDGTAVNTGHANGVMACIEKRLKKKLQRVVCLLHLNELPLRHLMEKLDGPTTGPKSLSGPVGQKLSNCENLPVVPFRKIEVQWLQNVFGFSDLSTDQQFLLDMCRAISSGVCPVSLANKKPGPLVQTRWLTTAARILRLYVSEKQPKETLCLLVEFVIKVYTPTWFEIKMEPSICHGAQHLFKVIQMTRSLPENIQKIVHTTVQTNGFFAHPENLLLAMIGDSRPEVRILGWQRIKTARQAERSRLRVFVVPDINFSAAEYHDMVNWTTTQVTEPPLTQYLSQDEIDENIKTAACAPHRISAFPCHTQAVERLVRVVTEAAGKVCGWERREDYIRVKLGHRKKMPNFSSKSDYVV